MGFLGALVIAVSSFLPSEEKARYLLYEGKKEEEGQRVTIISFMIFFRVEGLLLFSQLSVYHILEWCVFNPNNHKHIVTNNTY